MYSRMITCTIHPDKLDEFRSGLSQQLPRIQSQPGFIDNIESLDPKTGRFSCMTLWESASAVEKYDSGLFQEIASQLAPMMSDGPTVETLPVENSSAHNIQAGRAAA